MKRVLLLTGAMLLVASSAMAAMENVRFALHRKDKFSSTKTIPNLCDNPGTTSEEPNYSPNFDNGGAGTPCEQYTVTAPAPAPSTVYVVIWNPDSPISGASFGVDYDGSAGSGIDPNFTTWTLCADGLSFPNDGGNGEFPKPKGGIRLTWTLPTSCASETVGGIIHAMVGSFYVYAYSAAVLRLTENNNLVGGLPELAVADCAGATTLMEEIYPANLIDNLLGRVQFGAGNQGYIPCSVVPARSTTWGNIKTKYGE